MCALHSWDYYGDSSHDEVETRVYRCGICEAILFESRTTDLDAQWVYFEEPTEAGAEDELDLHFHRVLVDIARKLESRLKSQLEDALWHKIPVISRKVH